MQRLIVDLHISADEYKKMYAGLASSVVVVSRDGRRIRFPANLLRTQVRPDGIKGSFEFVLDDKNKLKKFRRLGL